MQVSDFNLRSRSSSTLPVQRGQTDPEVEIRNWPGHILMDNALIKPFHHGIIIQPIVCGELFNLILQSQSNCSGANKRSLGRPKVNSLMN